MKKILLLSFEMPPYVVGGIGTVAFEKIKGFKDLGYEVIVIAPKDNRNFDLDIRYYGIEIENNLKKTMQMLKYSIKICKKEKIDFIYCLTGTYTGIVGLLINIFFKIPYFTMAHGNEFIRFQKRFFIKKIINLVYKNSKKVFAVSKFTKNKLLEFGVNESKVKVCYNGVNLKKYHQISEIEKETYREKLNILKDKFILLTVSRLDERKNHIGVINAIEKLKEENLIVYEKLIYLIGGKGKQFDILKDYIKDKEIEKKVKLLGYVKDEDVNKLYNIASLFVMPNIYIEEDGNVEGFGLVFLEAGATKLTSIGGEVGGSAEAIDNNVNGYVIDGRDINEIKNKIIYLVEHKETLDKLSENALNKAKEYSWENVIKNINEEILLELGDD
jgi:phosphatidylinositol alpha-1,6-mannosyltransferase